MQGAIRGTPLPLGEVCRDRLVATHRAAPQVIVLFVIAYVLFQRREVRA
jgi:hypothetical protein